MLTAQAIADEGELEVLGFRCRRVQAGARADAASSPQLDNLDVTLTVEQNLRVFTHLYRVPRAERKRRDRAGAERSRTSTTGATPGSTSSPAACAGAC